MRRMTLAVLTVLAAASAVTAIASAQSTAAPTLVGNPTIQGQAAHPFVGDKLTVTNGQWSGSPTSFSYQWDRCDPTGDRQNCVPIAGATSQSYTVTTADINHTLEALVTAKNADGSTTKNTKGTGVVAARTSPKNTARPTISGSAVVGSTLTANDGTWTGAVTFSYQWQRCDSNGNNCADISGATGKVYGVTSSDISHELLVQVKASNRFGSTTASSDRTAPVSDSTQTQTQTTVVTVSGNKAPTIKFLSLKRVGLKIYARFRVCDDSPGRVRITERDNKARALSYTRHFAVTLVDCGTYTRHWLVIKRFRSHGRLVVALRASDAQGRLSRLVSRGVTIR